MAISAALLTSNANWSFPATLAYGTSLPVGTWIVIVFAGAGQGGIPTPAAFDSQGNTFPRAAGIIGNNNETSILFQVAQLTTAVGAADTVTPNLSGVGEVRVYKLTGAPNFQIAFGPSTSIHGQAFPFIPVHDTDLRLPATTFNGEQLILGACSAWRSTATSGDLTKALTLSAGAADDGSSQLEIGAGQYYTEDFFQTIPPAGSSQIGAQVTGPVGADANVWISNSLGITGIGLPGCDGVDLVRSSAGFLFIAWQDEDTPGLGTVKVARSTDQGDTFDLVVEVSADGDPCCAPALSIDAHDDLILAYHTPDPLVRIWRLPDLLEADPEPVGDFLALNLAWQFPRPLLIRPDLLLLVACNGDNLQVFRSEDLLLTHDLIKDYAAQAVDRAALWLDRHGILHIIFRSQTDALRWDWSKDFGETWNGATTLAVGCKAPSFASALDGFVAYFQGTTLNVKALGADYHTVDHAGTVPLASFKRLPCGTWVDERGDWWLLGRAASSGHALLPCQSPDGADTWTILAGGGL